MKILFENYEYVDVAKLSFLIDDKFISRLPNGNAYISYVGYYHNFHINETILILPKIFLFGSNILGTVPAELFLDFDLFSKSKNHTALNETCNFVYNFSFNFYLSLKKFLQRYHESTLPEEEKVSIISNIEQKSDHTQLDLILSLLYFYKEKNHLLTFIHKTFKSLNPQKINWSKTINRTIPILIENQPYYMEKYAEQRFINYDEELIRIFVSLIHKLSFKYNISIEVNPYFDKLNNADFAKFERNALNRLKSIKYKYFQDNLLKLYRLLVLYYNKQFHSSSHSFKNEYILVKNYNVVFEDMIDYLISDPKNHPHINFLKNQPDGKILDHVFKYKSLLSRDEIYFLGDSKYYKPNVTYSFNTIYKQHTYAKNVIQYNINLLNQDKLPNSLHYLDDLTEGYNITPNFFIQAFIPNDITDASPSLILQTEKPKLNFHFRNRLFDRDTLLIQSYQINFLFVVNAYISRNNFLLEYFRRDTHELFRNNSVNFYNQNYDFYYIEPFGSAESFVQKFFKILIGKIFRTEQQISTGKSLILALEKRVQENEKIFNLISDSCDYTKFILS